MRAAMQAAGLRALNPAQDMYSPHPGWPVRMSQERTPMCNVVRDISLHSCMLIPQYPAHSVDLKSNSALLLCKYIGVTPCCPRDLVSYSKTSVEIWSVHQPYTS